MKSVYIERNGEKFELTIEEINSIHEAKEIELCRGDIVSGFEDLPEDQDLNFTIYGLMGNEEAIDSMARQMRKYMRDDGLSALDARDDVYLEVNRTCEMANDFFRGLFTENGAKPVDIYNPIQKLYISSNGVDQFLIFNVSPEENDRIKELLNTAPDKKKQLMEAEDRAIDATPEAFFEEIMAVPSGWGTAQSKLDLINTPPETHVELKALCSKESVYLGDIDTSNINDMSYLFFNSIRTDFSGIETWDTSKVTTMEGMFQGARTFNEDISQWDVSKVTNMQGMFYCAYNFNQDLKSWKLNPNVKTGYMFQDCPIKQKFKPAKHRKNIAVLKNM